MPGILNYFLTLCLVQLCVSATINTTQLSQQATQAQLTEQRSVVESEYFSLSLSADDHEALLCGNSVMMENAPYIDGDILYLPLKDIVGIVGGIYKQKGNKAVVTTYDGRIIEYEVGNRRIVCDGEAYIFEGIRLSFSPDYLIDVTDEYVPSKKDGMIYIPAGGFYYDNIIPGQVLHSFEKSLVIFANNYMEKLISYDFGDEEIIVDVMMPYVDLSPELKTQLSSKGIVYGNEPREGGYEYEVELFSSNDIEIFVTHSSKSYPKDSDGMDGMICAVRVYTPKFMTMRGLRVGDSATRAERLYYRHYIGIAGRICIFPINEETDRVDMIALKTRYYS